MDQYVRLAKATVEKYINENETEDIPGDLPEEFYNEQAGIFVTIYKNGGLRGCIGTINPTKKNIAKEIVSNAIAASTRDYRFRPVDKSELPELTYEVSVLKAPEKVKDINAHDVREKGIIVKADDGRLGLLLPDIPSIDNAKEQIAIAAEKGGIDLDQDEVELLEFTVEKHQ